MKYNWLIWLIIIAVQTVLVLLAGLLDDCPVIVPILSMVIGVCCFFWWLDKRIKIAVDKSRPRGDDPE